MSTLRLTQLKPVFSADEDIECVSPLAEMAAYSSW